MVFYFNICDVDLDNNRDYVLQMQFFTTTIIITTTTANNNNWFQFSFFVYWHIILCGFAKSSL